VSTTSRALEQPQQRHQRSALRQRHADVVHSLEKLVDQLFELDEHSYDRAV
jgi:hypothetical protein